MVRAVHNEALIRALREERTAGHAEGEARHEMQSGALSGLQGGDAAPTAPKVGFVHRHPAARAALPRSPQLPASPTRDLDLRAIEEDLRPPVAVPPVRLAAAAPERREPHLRDESLQPAARKPALGSVQRIQPAVQGRPRSASPGAAASAPAVVPAVAPASKAVRGGVVRVKAQPARVVGKVRLPQKPQEGVFDNLSKTVFGLLVGVNFGLHIAMGLVFVFYWSKGFR